MVGNCISSPTVRDCANTFGEILESIGIVSDGRAADTLFFGMLDNARLDGWLTDNIRNQCLESRWGIHFPQDASNPLCFLAILVVGQHPPNEATDLTGMRNALTQDLACTESVDRTRKNKLIDIAHETEDRLTIG